MKQALRLLILALAALAVGAQAAAPLMGGNPEPTSSGAESPG
jgi:hypothetical protein